MNLQFSVLEKYCQKALDNGASDAKLIHPSTVVIADWVRLKCQFGCPNYGKRYSCPPDSPKPEETSRILGDYQTAILFHMEFPHTTERAQKYKSLFKVLVDLEGDMFKDGYYKAFIFLSGPCMLCKECAKTKGAPCVFPYRARPCMESCGIDVYQTARNNGFKIQPLREKWETHNDYCLMLVD